MPRSKTGNADKPSRRLSRHGRHTKHRYPQFPVGEHDNYVNSAALKSSSLWTSTSRVVQAVLLLVLKHWPPQLPQPLLVLKHWPPQLPQPLLVLNSWPPKRKSRLTARSGP